MNKPFNIDMQHFNKLVEMEKQARKFWMERIPDIKFEEESVEEAIRKAITQENKS